MRDVDHMVWSEAETTSGLVGDEIEDEQVVCERESAAVEEDVIVRAETEDVACLVRSVVWPAQGTDVGAFSVGAAGELESEATDLAAVAV